MVHISTEAIKTKSRSIDIGHSVHGFLMELGISTGGGPRGGYTTFKKQMKALAACQLTLGYSVEGMDVTVKTNPIDKFVAWTQSNGSQLSLWPGELELSQKFYDTLIEHAVPVDYRALAALKHSSLSLDVYTWLAQRLCRVRNSQGVRLSWDNLMEQFGQEYEHVKQFKRKFLIALRQVLAVYPDAKIKQVRGGMMLYSSPPPLPKTQVVVELPSAEKSKWLP